MATDTQQGEKNLPTSEIVREGANLPAEEWNEARIAAARKMLPQGFRDPANMIAYLARAQRSGLDPFSGELHAWEEGGELTFQTSRDGFIKVLRRDEKVSGVEVGAVYENDEFSYTKKGGDITVEHSGSMDRGDLMGAYCCIHVDDGEDHIEVRLLEDFDHLLSKRNWQDYPIDMLQTRCVSAAARFVTTATAGIYSEADFELREGGRRTAARVRDRAEEDTQELGERLREEAAGDGEYSEPIEAEVVEEGEIDEEDAEDVSEPDGTGPSSQPVQPEKHDTAGDGESDVVPPPEDDRDEEDTARASSESDETQGIEEAADEDGFDVPCPICGKTGWSGPQALAGHKAGHSKRGETLPEGMHVEQGERERGGPPVYYLIDEDGTIVGETDGFSHWKKALAWANEEEDGEEGEEDALAAVREEFEGKTRGEILVSIYEELQDMPEEKAERLLYAEAADVHGADVEPDDLSLNDLSRDERLELIVRLRQETA